MFKKDNNNILLGDPKDAGYDSNNIRNKLQLLKFGVWEISREKTLFFP